MKNLNFATILKDAKKFKPSTDNSYAQTYRHFINYFDTIKQGDDNDINEHHLVIASHFVYGWMPTIIKLNLQDKDQVLRLLNDAKGGRILTVNELETLKSAINNSMVGVSKLLHFIRPQDYAIWDSRIYRYVTEKKSTYEIAKPQLYLEYLQGIRDIAQHQNYQELHKLIAKHFDYQIFPTRAIEVTMFEADRNRQKGLK